MIKENKFIPIYFSSMAKQCLATYINHSWVLFPGPPSTVNKVSCSMKQCGGILGVEMSVLI